MNDILEKEEKTQYHAAHPQTVRHRSSKMASFLAFGILHRGTVQILTVNLHFVIGQEKYLLWTIYAQRIRLSSGSWCLGLLRPEVIVLSFDQVNVCVEDTLGMQQQKKTFTSTTLQRPFFPYIREKIAP